MGSARARFWKCEEAPKSASFWVITPRFGGSTRNISHLSGMQHGIQQA